MAGYSQHASDRSFKILWEDGVGDLLLMNSALEQIWSRRPAAGDDGYVLISDGKIAESIVNFVSHFGRASTVLFDDSPKRSSENAVVYRMRTDRVKRARDFFGEIDVSIFKDRRIRNRHFHADEYVSKLLAQHPDAFIIRDLSFDRREAFQGDVSVVYIRVFEYSTDRLLHLGTEFDAKHLYETSLLMLEKLKTSGLVEYR